MKIQTRSNYGWLPRISPGLTPYSPLKHLAKYEGGTETGVVGYFGDRLVGGFEHLLAAGKARLSEKLYGGCARECLYLAIELPVSF